MQIKQFIIQHGTPIYHLYNSTAESIKPFALSNEIIRTKTCQYKIVIKFKIVMSVM